MKRTTHLLLTFTLLVVAAPVHAIVLPCVTGSPTRTPTRTPTATITPTFTLTPTHTPTGGALPTTWAHAYGGTAGPDNGTAVAVDASGNVYLAGSYATAATFGGGTLPCNSTANNLVVAKYTSGGTLIWQQCAGGGAGGGNALGRAIATDSSGNVVVAGYMLGAVNFGAAGTLNSPMGYGGFVAQLNSAGNFVWAKQFGVPIGFVGLNAGRGVAVDNSGNILLAGRFYLTLNLGGVCPVQNAAGGAGFVAQLNPTTGVCQWVKSFGTTSVGEAGAVAVDRATNTVVVTGDFGGTTSFGGPPISSIGNSLDVFVAKYAADGSYQWANGYGGTVTDAAYGIAVDSNSHIAITGSFGGTGNFGSGDLVSGSQTNIVIATYFSDGTGFWSHNVGDVGDYNAGFAIATDTANNVIVTGEFYGTANFGPGNITSSSVDAFIARYLSDGTILSATRHGGLNIDQGQGIAIDSNNFIITTGYFTSSITFGSTNLTGGADCYLAKIAP